MSYRNCFFGFLKKLTIFSLIVAVAIPIYYGSTSHQYVCLRLYHSVLSLKFSFISDQSRPNLSADYRAFEEIMRNVPLAELDPKEDIVNIIKDLRSAFTMSTIIPKPSQCQINKEAFQHDEHTIDIYWINYFARKFERNSDKLLLYFHGGGYMLGDIHSYSGFECHLSHLFNLTILHLEYRLCPEHPLPAGVDDAVSLYHALLLNNISSSQILIMGDSAGGGLSLLTIQALIARQLAIPRGVIVLSPWTDLSASGESYKRNRPIDIIFRNTKEDDDEIIKLMLGPNSSQLSADNPIFSPLFGSFEGFPPMYINVGTAEILEDDSRRVLNKAHEANVAVTFEEGLHLMHAYPVFFLYYPEARNTLNNINKWIQKIFDKKLNT
ncbi:unnamed protein product [Rotaria sp. Silwood1]|nr:unnamed protein product [Rotaria sp. Silwood1]CAF3910476.1 unnamed protein product [Rotaria sp. Silwood1]CAF4565461.1 unnamed protein product [Rotaria sp. Silwood1]CAF4798317.1 unnamed protein product [Rotaria sp. Silwood1]CAF4844496.1 unnamed protein product [Rotaria sp. Silwood1]